MRALINKVENRESPVQGVIRSIISDLQGAIDIAEKFHQEFMPKYRELKIRKQILEEMLEASESKIKIEPEIQLRDIWARNNEE